MKISIAQVILRLDFLEAIKEININIDEAYKKIIKSYFKKEIETVTGTSFILTVDTDGKPNQPGQEKEIIYGFTDVTNKNKFNISQTNISFSLLKFNEIEKFDEISNDIIKKFMYYYDKAVIARIGYRFIITIEDDGETYKWDGEVKNLLSVFQDNNYTKDLCRSMTRTEYNDGNVRMTFSHGFWNVDYPSINKKKEYLMDVDGYTLSRITNAEDAIGKIDEINKKVKNLCTPYLGDGFLNNGENNE